MAIPKETIWEADPHTIAKHHILQSYLGAWFPILSSWNGRIIYLDGFAGPGLYKGGEHGSPVVALKTALSHSNRLRNEIIFLFIEKDSERCENLINCIKQIELPGNFKPKVINNSFSLVANQILDKIEKANDNLAPTFAFIDPFGFGDMPYEIIHRILANKSCEVFVNLMIDSVNRFVNHPNDKIRTSIANLLGKQYVERVLNSSEDRLSLIIQCYCEMLKERATYVRAFEMKNKDGRTIYYLLFASNHALGFSKMKEAMRRVSENQSFYTFSDAINPLQSVIFRNEDTTNELLESILLKEFRNKGLISGKQINDFVNYKTDFILKDKTACLNAMKLNGKLVVAKLLVGGSPYKPQHKFGEKVQLTFV